MSKTTNKFSPQVRERAVRMVLDSDKDHASRWTAVLSIAGKICCSAYTLLEWVKKAEATEMFTLNLNWATGGAVISDGQGVGLIYDDDKSTDPMCGQVFC